MYLISPFLSEKFALLKLRVRRPYVHPALDSSIQKYRLQQEARALLRCRKAGLDVPGVLWVQEIDCASPDVLRRKEKNVSTSSFPDLPNSESSDACGRLVMEWIDGCSLKALLEKAERRFLFEENASSLDNLLQGAPTSDILAKSLAQQFAFHST